MALIRGNVTDLLTEADSGHLHTRLREQFGYVVGNRAGLSEVNSWQNSLPVLFRDLMDAGLGEVEVLLEHQLPHSKMRIDVVLCGIASADSARPASSSWSSSSGHGRGRCWNRSLPCRGSGMHLHPAEQVRGYCQYFIDHTPALAVSTTGGAGLAYLHNARRADVAGGRVNEPYGRLFTMDDRAEAGRPSAFRARGRRHAAIANRDAGDEFLGFEHRPTKPFLGPCAAELQDREQFVLLDEQKVAYEFVLEQCVTIEGGEDPHVVIVMGGPGSGKSVIALSLIGELARRGVEVAHATGSKSFTQTMRKYAGRATPACQHVQVLQLLRRRRARASCAC